MNETITHRELRNTVTCACAALLLALFAAGCATTGRDWEAARSADSLEAYQLFLDTHPTAQQAVYAKRRHAELREQAAWQTATSANTAQAYTDFLREYPQGSRANDAKKRVYQINAKAEWTAAEAANTIKSYSSFLQSYDKSQHAEQARQALRSLEADRDWQMAEKENTASAYAKFLEDHPSSSHAAEARAVIVRKEQEEQRKAIASSFRIAEALARSSVPMVECVKFKESFGSGGLEAAGFDEAKIDGAEAEEGIVTAPANHAFLEVAWRVPGFKPKSDEENTYSLPGDSFSLLLPDGTALLPIARGQWQTLLPNTGLQKVWIPYRGDSVSVSGGGKVSMKQKRSDGSVSVVGGGSASFAGGNIGSAGWVYRVSSVRPNDLLDGQVQGTWLFLVPEEHLNQMEFKCAEATGKCPVRRSEE